MQHNAVSVDEQRHQRLYKKGEDEKEESGNGGGNNRDAKFLKDLNKQVYMGSDMKLEERLNRKAHYMDRHSARD